VGSGGTHYGDELDLYLNQLLDEALDEPRPGGDAPSRPEVDKKRSPVIASNASLDFDTQEQDGG
jgi:hypothetical protein